MARSTINYFLAIVVLFVLALVAFNIALGVIWFAGIIAKMMLFSLQGFFVTLAMVAAFCIALYTSKPDTFDSAVKRIERGM